MSDAIRERISQALTDVGSPYMPQGDWPLEMYPGRKPVNGIPHTLEVDEDNYHYILHTDDCLDSYGEVLCDVSYAQDWNRDEELPKGLVPGEYWIVFHVEGCGEDVEIDLDLMYPEEA